MNKKVLITGANGLVGSAAFDLNINYKELDFVPITRKMCNLTNEKEVVDLFKHYKPNYVLHAAARVGGIGGNLTHPVQQFNDNILMNAYVIREAYENKVEKFIGFGSVCAFPGDLDKLKEENYLQGEPYPAHKSYAYAKRMLSVQLEAYKQQHNFNSCVILPANIFGENDNFNLADGHVVPSLIHKCFLAKRDNVPFQVWGNGSARREFLYAKDVAEICLKLLTRDEELPGRLIISGGKENSIKEVVEKLCDIFDYHNVEWQTDKPNGQKARPTDKELFTSLFPYYNFTDVDWALKQTVEWFKINYPHVRK
jgi:GDP-L-fucose synthase